MPGLVELHQESVIAPLKLGLVAWLCFVVKNPEQGESSFFLPSDSYAVNEGLLLPGWHKTIESPMLDKGASWAQKSATIMRQLQPAARSVLALAGEDDPCPLYVQLTDEFLELGIYPEIQVGAGEILPERTILGAILRACSGLRMKPCPKLDGWIQNGLSQSDL